ncbi:MAG TPA: ribosome-associated translation inhibitor RaiA [Candidatus Paceibacterota bacterium]
MKINFKVTNLELTPEILDYCRDKLESIDKLLSQDDGAFMEVELGKTTQHHKQGEIFRTEANLHTSLKNFRSESVAEDLYATIDEVKDELATEVKRFRKKRGTLLRRGGRMVKDLLRGVYNYKWRKH